MFGTKKKPSGETVEAQGVVLKTTWISENKHKAEYRIRVKVRVQFDDGATSEFSAICHHLVSVGDVLPVRYDATDRSAIELSGDSTFKEQKAARQAAGAARVASAEQRLSGDTATAIVDPRIDMTRLALQLAQRRGDAAKAAELTKALELMQTGAVNDQPPS